MPWLVDRRPLNMDLYIYYRVPAGKAPLLAATSSTLAASPATDRAAIRGGQLTKRR